MENIRILKGQIIYTKHTKSFEIHEDSYIVAVDDIIEGIYKTLPEKYDRIAVEDHGQSLIIPSFSDLHVHAPQYVQMGLAMDLELIDWLNTYTFKEESRFVDVAYAREVYRAFAKAVYNKGTRRAAVFATIHPESTLALMDIMAEEGLSGYVGKVNMDQNSDPRLTETTQQSLQDTETLILKSMGNTKVKPMLTPRFSPTCSDALLAGLGQLAQKYKVPVQSHISETIDEVAWVKALFPDAKHYSDTYDRHGLFGQTPTLMAHGIHLTEDEIELVKERQVVLVHCPASNSNIASGAMKVVDYLDRGLNVALGTDVGGGNSLSMPRTMVDAMQVSKLLKHFGMTKRHLTLPEAFHMATKGGGSFFGRYGSFEPGYVLDPLVIDSDPLMTSLLTPIERLQRYIYSQS